jgi:probable F420-dependent oxidoreductase
VTSKIRLATGVVILPLRNPVLLAKEVATLDQLSSGRVLLGIGIGWMRSEFDALGSDFSDRGRRTDEYLQVLRRLWEPGPVSFTGKYISFGPIFCNPRPVHPEGIPLLIAGSSDFAARRAGRFGDGFTPLDVDVSRLQELLLVMRKEAEMAGRDPDAIELTVRGDADAQAIAAMERIGVDRYVLRAPDGVNLAENPDLLISLASQLGLEATKN